MKTHRLGFLQRGNKLASIVQFQYALELDKHRSFSKAAKASFVTQPTLSMQLQKLEDEYNIILFDRSRKPVEPTDQGIALLKQFRIVIDEFERVAQIANSSKNLISGSYRLGIIPTIAPTILPNFIKLFSEKYPQVETTIIEMPTNEIIQNLLDSKIDAGIASTPLEHPSLNETKLYLEPFSIFHSEKIALKTQSNGKVKTKDLPLDKLLVLTEGNCLRTQALDLCAMNEMAPLKHSFNIEASSLLTLLNIVDSGDYFTILPALSANALTTKQKNRQTKEFDGKVPCREIGFVTHRSQVKSQINSAAISVLGKILPENLLSKKSGMEIINPLT